MLGRHKALAELKFQELAWGMRAREQVLRKVFPDALPPDLACIEQVYVWKLFVLFDAPLVRQSCRDPVRHRGKGLSIATKFKVVLAPEFVVHVARVGEHLVQVVLWNRVLYFGGT